MLTKILNMFFRPLAVIKKIPSSRNRIRVSPNPQKNLADLRSQAYGSAVRTFVHLLHHQARELSGRASLIVSYG